MRPRDASIEFEQHLERVVSGRASVLALAAIASIGAAALITSISSADARGFGGGVSRGGVHFGSFRSSYRHSGLRFHQRRHWHVRWHRPWIHGVGTVATPTK
jgi:hypothetical protein